MTVCIVARANDGSLFIAADRMVTVGDMEMESPVQKVFMMTSSIAVMPSDEDAALHTEILHATYDKIEALIALDPKEWVPVQTVVDKYVESYNEMKAKLAERTFLAPQRLTHEKFRAEMSTMDAAVVARITEDIVNFKMPSMSLIICGRDTSGRNKGVVSHIYEVHDGETGCFDTIGYAAIGAGGRHARAHFMIAGQSGESSINRTLLNTYFAKRRAEVAPGVGEETDIGMIGPQLGYSTSFNKTEVSKQLEKIYKATVRSEEKARGRAAKEIDEYVERRINAPNHQTITQAANKTLAEPDKTEDGKSQTP